MEILNCELRKNISSDIGIPTNNFLFGSKSSSCFLEKPAFFIVWRNKYFSMSGGVYGGGKHMLCHCCFNFSSFYTV